MSRREMSRSVRRAFTIHAVSTVLVSLVVAALASLISTAIAVEAARDEASAVARTVALAVVAPLTLLDLSTNSPDVREAALLEIQAFIDGGVIDRAKIWQVDGDEVVVLYSDEPRNEGARRPFDPVLGERLDSGEVVILDVPDDDEHQYEYGEAGLLEAFIGFDDASGQAMRLEIYLPSVADRALSDLLSIVLPVAVLGPLVLGAATLPLALRLARRMDAREAERRALLQTALAASDRERRRLAARLHDGLIQDLASVGLVLDSLEQSVERDPDRSAQLTRAINLLDSDVAGLRNVLTELAPPEFQGSLVNAMQDLADDIGRGLVDLDIHEPTEATPEAAALVYRVARELIRNAIVHGEPSRVRVRLRGDEHYVTLDVIDDGGGFDPSAPAPEGHLGLSLIRQAVVDSSGTFRIMTGTSGTSAHVRIPTTTSTQ